MGLDGSAWLLADNRTPVRFHSSCAVCIARLAQQPERNTADDGYIMIPKAKQTAANYDNRVYQEETHFIERTPYLYIGMNTIRNNHQHKSEYEKHKLISAKQAKS